MIFKKLGVYILIWLTFVVLFIVVLGNFIWVDSYQIVNRCKVGVGKVTELFPVNNSIRYIYEVNGRTYYDRRIPRWPNPSVYELRKGQMIIVYYDSECPENSVIEDPKAQLDNVTIFILLAALSIPTLALLGSCRKSLYSFHIPKLTKEHTIELELSLSPDEVISRLVNACDEEQSAFSSSGLTGKHPFLLKISDERFRIHKYRCYANGFHPYLFAQVEQTPFGSKIAGSFAISWGTRAFMILWFIFGILFGIVNTINIISGYLNGVIPRQELVWLIYPFALPLFGFLIVVLGKYLSREDESAISEMLHSIFADTKV
ncbi:MAG: DUF3592 domain-containing protein [Armatimonadota bacterium]